MAITKISEWSTTAGSNTEIDGISLAEGVMTPSTVNNAMREHMSQVAEMYAGTTGDAWPVAAGGTGATSAAGARANLGIISANESAAGILRFATAAELTTGTSDSLGVTPKKLTEFAPASATIDTALDEILFKDASDSQKVKRGAFPSTSVSAATESTTGVLRFATAAEMTTGTSDSLGVSPKKLTEFAPATATLDTTADKVLFRDATDGKLKLDALPAASSSLVFIGTSQITSGVASVTITGLNMATYLGFLISFQGLEPATDNVRLKMQIGDSGGLHTSSNYYGYATGVDSGAGGANQSIGGVDGWWLTSARIRNSTYGGASGHVWLYGQDNSSIPIHMVGQSTSWDNGGGAATQWVIGGTLNSSGPTPSGVDRIAFLYSAGNINKGRITVHGLKAS